MIQSHFEDSLLMLIAAGVFDPDLSTELVEEEEKKKRSTWVIPMFQARNTEGYCAIDYPRLRADPHRFKVDFHMKLSTFDYILQAVGPSLEHPTPFREPIEPRDRLIVALR